MFVFSTSVTNKSYQHQQQVGLEKLITNPSKRSETRTDLDTSVGIKSTRHEISDIVSSILLGPFTDKDFFTNHAGFLILKDSPKASLEFPPGSLSLSHAQTLSHCWADNKTYANHFQGNRGDGSNVLVSYSDEYKLAYVMIPKSGSSTARFMLKEHFNAVETSKPLLHSSFIQGGQMEGVSVFTFVRDPLSRFFSQYDEAFARTAPWKSKSKSKSHPFPYLHEGLHSYEDYEDIFCPPSTRKTRKDCTFRESQEDGTLVSRFERFIFDYNGLDPFDVHLKLQVPMLSSVDGLPLYVSQIYNTSDAKSGWNAIAKQFLNKTLDEKDGEDGGVIAGRSYPRRFNSKLVSVETQRRICELTLLDYCCLNLPLPDVCKGFHYAGVDGEKRELFCTLSVDDSIKIQPGIFPKKQTIS